MGIYNDPVNNKQSSIGEQIRTDVYDRKAIYDLRDEMIFTQLGSVKNQPKHYGKSLKMYHYLPLIDARNINDQGIDASGATITNGNLYADSRDITDIQNAMPDLTENGGDVNRVGFTRLLIESELNKFGFHYTYTNESIQFDSDSEKQMHCRREAINGATKIQEDQIQMDLLYSPGIVKYPGTAIADNEISGEAGAVTVVTYADIKRMTRDLTDNKTPKKTTIVKGSTFIDTLVVPAARYAYVGPELRPVLEQMLDYSGRPAFKEVQHYAAAGNIAHGEIGCIGEVRFIEAQEMMNYGGVGATATGNNDGYVEKNNKYVVHPMLFVGDESFAVIAFKHGAKSDMKFKIKSVDPESDISYSKDVFGEKGFTSIKWYYGFICMRPERIGVIKTVAPI